MTACLSGSSEEKAGRTSSASLTGKSNGQFRLRFLPVKHETDIFVREL